MIVDSHMHVGDFPRFTVSLDRAGLVGEMREHGIDSDLVSLNVYLETPGMPMHSKIREAVERVGPRPSPIRLGYPVPSSVGGARQGASEWSCRRI